MCFCLKVSLAEDIVVTYLQPGKMQMLPKWNHTSSPSRRANTYSIPTSLLLMVPLIPTIRAHWPSPSLNAATFNTWRIYSCLLTSSLPPSLEGVAVSWFPNKHQKNKLRGSKCSTGAGVPDHSTQAQGPSNKNNNPLHQSSLSRRNASQHAKLFRAIFFPL